MGRTTVKQLEIYLSALSKHNVLIKYTVVDPLMPSNRISNLWNEIVRGMNSCEQGPKMGVHAWKKVNL